MTAHTTTDRTRWAALYVLCAGMLMIVLDVTIVNVALPSIQEDLGFSQSNLAWVVNAYLIAFGGLLLLAGRVGDLIGPRRVFLGGLALFTLASLACAVAQTQGMLIGARFVQGVGGALTSAVILGMIVTLFPEPREQAKALGVYGFVASAGGSIGLLTGGLLTDAISWHWIFFVNVPIGIAVALGAMRLVEDRDGIGLGQGADVPGAALLTAGLMLGVYAILQVSEHGWGATRTIVLGAVSLGLLAAFLIRQTRIANPLMPLRLFRSRTTTGANLVMALLVVGMFGVFFLGALYLQQILGYDALEVGLAFLPSTLVMGTLSLGVAGRLAVRFGPQRVLVPSLVFIAAGLAAVHAVAGERQLRRARAADGDPDGRRRRPGDAVAHDARDGRRDAERRGPGLGPRQHDDAGRRRDRPGRAGDARGRPDARRGRPGRLGGRGAELRVPSRVPGRRRAPGAVRRGRRCGAAPVERRPALRGPRAGALDGSLRPETPEGAGPCDP